MMRIYLRISEHKKVVVAGNDSHVNRGNISKTRKCRIVRQTTNQLNLGFRKIILRPLIGRMVNRLQRGLIVATKVKRRELMIVVEFDDIDTAAAGCSSAGKKQNDFLLRSVKQQLSERDDRNRGEMVGEKTTQFCCVSDL